MDVFFGLAGIALIFLFVNADSWVGKFAKPWQTAAEARRLNAQARLIEAETARDAARK